MTRHVCAAIVILALAALACGQYIPTVTPTAAPSATPTPTASPAPTATVTPFPTSEDVNTVTIRAVVYIRAEADANSAAVGSLETGQRVEVVECSAEWCEIRTPVQGYVWRGCTSDPAGLSCEAR
jgi:uncharacterized protein YgiM (DUF1202 family)